MSFELFVFFCYLTGGDKYKYMDKHNFQFVTTQKLFRRTNKFFGV